MWWCWARREEDFFSKILGQLLGDGVGVGWMSFFQKGLERARSPASAAWRVEEGVGAGVGGWTNDFVTPPRAIWPDISLHAPAPGMLGFIDPTTGRIQPEYYGPYYKWGIAGNCANFADTSIASHFNANWANPFRRPVCHRANMPGGRRARSTDRADEATSRTRQRSVGGLKVKRRFKFIFLDGNTGRCIHL